MFHEKKGIDYLLLRTEQLRFFFFLTLRIYQWFFDFF